MESQINPAPIEEEIYVNRNTFYRGVLMLAKKLFML